MSTHFMNIQDVCDYFGVSKPTIRRRIKEHQEGVGTFPIPVFGLGRKLLWRKTDIENWSERAKPDPIPDSKTSLLDHTG